MTEFEGIVPALGQALTKRGYTELTPVQEAVLAPEVDGVDALVSAQTGSGKTVAFGLAIAPTLLGDAERFEHADAPLALAVAPTRELALQVKRELEWLYEMTGAKVASCVGGMDMRTERRALQRGAHIVVGTPGRLRDHIQRNSLDTSQLKAVVLDEADEMLDLGFREDLEFILDAAPEDRRTLLFSATVPRTIANLAKQYQRDAVRISTAGEQKQHLDIEYRALTVASYERENAIINVLRYFEAKNALVFCATRATVTHMTARFNNRGFSVVALSGELSQNERTHALQAMRDGRARVCIATDVAARGLDLPNLELVIHADLPANREALVHRSGRTGRAGRKGVSVLMVPNNRRRQADRLLSSAGIDAIWAKPPSAEVVMQRDDERVLADPALSEPVNEDEQAFVGKLLERHSAEQVAAAFIRLYRAGQSAPEELQDNTPPERPDRPERKKNPRDDFGDAVWISISVGRNQNAEPRWILPMLCEAGQITKREIGAIKMQPDETFVEIAAGSADQFLTAIGPDKKLEKNITVKRLDGRPEMAPRGQGKPYAGKSGAGKPSTGKAYEGRKSYDPKKPYEPKKSYDSKKRYDSKKPYEPKKSYDPRASEARSKPKPKRDYEPKSKDQTEDVAPEQELEDYLTANRRVSPPKRAGGPGGKPYSGKPAAGKKSYGVRKSDTRGKPKRDDDVRSADRASKANPDRVSGSTTSEKRLEGTLEVASSGPRKPYAGKKSGAGKFGAKSKGKKPGKPKFAAKGGAKSRGPGKPSRSGDAPLRRTKPKS